MGSGLPTGDNSKIFEKIKNELNQTKKTIIPGKYVFKLYDTYGFPVDLTQILADENGLTLEMQDFEKLIMQESGKDCSSDVWKLCEKALGAPVESVDDLIRGWNLARQRV